MNLYDVLPKIDLSFYPIIWFNNNYRDYIMMWLCIEKNNNHNFFLITTKQILKLHIWMFEQAMKNLFKHLSKSYDMDMMKERINFDWKYSNSEEKNLCHVKDYIFIVHHFIACKFLSKM